MQPSRAPDHFMQGIFLAPHTFTDPEHPEHGAFVNLQLKNDLYFSSLEEISRVQFRTFNFFGTDEWIKVLKMRECVEPSPWHSQYCTLLKAKQGRSLNNKEGKSIEMVSCQEWDVEYNYGQNKVASRYRVQFFQSEDDIFRSQIFPPTLFKAVKDLILN